MSAVEEWLETGPDYQKAKRSAFLISFVALALAFSTNKGSNQLTIRILDVELALPLASILAVVLLALGYCAYSYHIQQKRASIEHSALVKSYGDITLKEALDNLKEAFSQVMILVGEANTEISHARSWAGYDGKLQNITDIGQVIGSMNQDFSIITASKIAEKMSELLSNGNKLLLNDDFNNEMQGLVHSLGKNHAQNLNHHILHSINNAINSQVSEINYRAQSGVNHMQRVADEILPNINAKIDLLKTGLSHLSDKVEPRERNFFIVETWIIRITLAAAFFAAAGRIAYGVFPALQQLSLAALTTCLA